MTGTADEPQYAAAGWAMLEGNPEFTIEIGSTKGWYFDIETFPQRYILPASCTTVT